MVISAELDQSGFVYLFICFHCRLYAQNGHRGMQWRSNLQATDSVSVRLLRNARSDKLYGLIAVSINDCSS